MKSDSKSLFRLPHEVCDLVYDKLIAKIFAPCHFERVGFPDSSPTDPPCNFQARDHSNLVGYSLSSEQTILEDDSIRANTSEVPSLVQIIFNSQIMGTRLAQELKERYTETAEVRFWYLNHFAAAFNGTHFRLHAPSLRRIQFFLNIEQEDLLNHTNETGISLLQSGPLVGMSTAFIRKLVPLKFLPNIAFMEFRIIVNAYHAEKNLALVCSLGKLVDELFEQGASVKMKLVPAKSGRADMTGGCSYWLP